MVDPIINPMALKPENIYSLQEESKETFLVPSKKFELDEIKRHSDEFLESDSEFDLKVLKIESIKILNQIEEIQSEENIVESPDKPFEPIGPPPETEEKLEDNPQDSEEGKTPAEPIGPPDEFKENPKEESLETEEIEVQENDEPSLGSKIAKGLMYAGAATVAVSAVPIIAGFGTAGIGAGTIAAGIQSGIGNVASGSLFAIMQSLGAQGIFTSAAIGGGATAGVGATIKSFFSRKDKDQRK